MTNPYTPYPISGYAKDKNSIAVVGATIVAENLTTNTFTSAVTSSTGFYLVDIANIGYSNGDIIRIAGRYLHTINVSDGYGTQDVHVAPLYCHTSITPYSKTNAKQMRITADITLSNFTPVTDVGTNKIRDFLGGTKTGYPTYMAWGTGSTQIETTDTVLENEVERNALNAVSRPLEARFESTLTTAEGNGSSISRLGLFNDASAGSMFIEPDMSSISKNSGYEIQTQISIFVE